MTFPKNSKLFLRFFHFLNFGNPPQGTSRIFFVFLIFLQGLWGKPVRLFHFFQSQKGSWWELFFCFCIFFGHPRNSKKWDVSESGPFPESTVGGIFFPIFFFDMFEFPTWPKLNKTIKFFFYFGLQ